MDLESQDNERFFNDFITRYPTTDSHTLRVDLDLLRQQYPQAAQDLMKNPTKYYKLARNLLEKNRIGDQKPRY
jgi:hypothetical protein